jgi:cystathionine beta-lyase
MLDNLIFVSAASKTFNVAGLNACYAVIPNESLRTRFLAQFVGSTGASYVGKLAIKACYTESDEYLEQVKAYITGNLDFFVNAVQERLAPLKTLRPEGTYLVWVDCRALNLEQKDLMRWLMEDMKIRLNDGTTFGPGGEGFVRVNLACPRMLLEEAVERLEAGLKTIQKH